MDYREFDAVAEDFQGQDFDGLGSLSVGDLLGTTLRVVWANLPSFVVISLIILSPFTLLFLVTEMMFITLFSTVGEYVVQAMVVYAVVQHLAGKEVIIGEALSKGFRRLLPVLLAAIFVGLIVGIGYVFCIVPGIILQCIFILTIPIIVAENSGVKAAMNRSTYLTNNYKMTIFWGLFVLFLFAMVGGLLFLVLEANESIIAAFTAKIFLDILGTVLFGAYAAVCYVRLRGIKEGMDAEKLVNIFE